MTHPKATLKAHSVNLADRVLWFDGDSTVPDGEIIRLLVGGLPVDGLFVNSLTDEIAQYNQLVPVNERIGIKHNLRTLGFEWNLPEEYQDLDVDRYVTEKCAKECDGYNDQSDYVHHRVKRVVQELALYRDLELHDVLRSLIYIINTLHASNVIWSVGRGSSVSSYILYLIGVHDVDSVKYGLDIREFLRPQK